MAVDGTHDELMENPPETRLKYLDFIHSLALKVIAFITSLYEFAKENSRTLRPGVESVERTVKKVMSPLYCRIEAKLLILLCYFDKKVDEVVTFLGNHLPQDMKENLHKIFITLLDAPNVGKSFITEVQKQGVHETTKNYYVKYEPVAEDMLFNAWKNLLKLPMVAIVMDLMAAPVIFCMYKYNDVVDSLKNNTVPLASYIPLLPVEKIERAVKVNAD